MTDTCPNCGGDMVGDGHTLTQHCSRVDLPVDTEADAGPLYCGPQEDALDSEEEIERLRHLLEDKAREIQALRARILCLKRDVNTASVTLRKLYGDSGEAPPQLCHGIDLTKESWRMAVLRRETSRGYWAWVASRMDLFEPVEPGDKQ